MLGDFLALELKLAFDEFVLGPDRDQLPGSHGKGTGKETGHTGQPHWRSRCAGPRNPENERHVGDQPVARPEDGSTRRTSLHVAVPRMVVQVSAGDPGGQGTEG